jgi:hypothetical protein
MKFSTEVRRQQAVVGSLKSILDGGVMRFYNGPVPASADSALSGNTLLLELKTSIGGNLTFDPNADGAVLKKALSEIWTGDAVAAGNMTFCRYEKPADTGGAGTGEVRVQATVGGPAADITVSTTLIEVGETRTLEYFAIELIESV